MKGPNPDQKYVVLEARYKPAFDRDGRAVEPPLFNAYLVVKGEVTARSATAALTKAKHYHPFPIVEEAQSFWARIEAAKALNNARKAQRWQQPEVVR